MTHPAPPPDGRRTSRVFVSYSHDSERHKKAVLTLAQRLRGAGVDVWIDLFEEHEPPESWPHWMHTELDRADFVLVVVTAGYVERFGRRSAAGVGNGVRWEGALITSELYNSRREKAKFIPVVPRAEDRALIPYPLDQTSWFVIGESGDADLGGLLRVLRREPHADATPSVLGSAPATAGLSDRFPDIPPSPQLDAALDRAARGDVAGAIRGIDDALGTLRGVQRAHAIHLMGTLHHESGNMIRAISCFTRVLETTGHPGLRARATARLEILHTEFDAHYGEQGPVAAAHAWLLCLREGRMRKAWKRLDRNIRLALAQDWIITNRSHPEVRRHNRDALANALAERVPKHPLAESMVTGRLEAALHNHFSDWDPDTWGAAGTPRRIGLDHEVVVMAPADGDVLVIDEETRPQIGLLLRRVGSEWRVANFVPAYVIPGWPPRLEDIAWTALDGG